MANLAHVDSRPFSNDQIDLGSSINLKFNDILPESPSFTHLWCIYNASNHNLSTAISTKHELISWYWMVPAIDILTDKATNDNLE